MRLFHALLMIPLLGTPALAASDSTAQEHHGRRSAEQHFADANTTHDGKLTLDQATSGYKSIAKSFAQIDASHHGYVTMADIKAWRAAKKAARQAAKRSADANSGGLPELIPAVQRNTGPHAMDNPLGLFMPTGSVGSPRIGVDLPPAPLDDNHHS